MMSCPAMLTSPSLGARLPLMTCMVVDLPAPFGPRKPSTSPAFSVKLSCLTAQ